MAGAGVGRAADVEGVLLVLPVTECCCCTSETLSSDLLPRTAPIRLQKSSFVISGTTYSCNMPFLCYRQPHTSAESWYICYTYLITTTAGKLEIGQTEVKNWASRDPASSRKVTDPDCSNRASWSCYMYY